MLISIIMIIISFVMDGVLTNFLPYGVGDLSLFTPLTTLTCLIVIYPLFYRNNKKYFILCGVVGILYDLFYTNLLFFNALLFLLMGFIITKLYKNVGDGYLKAFLYIIIIIVIYETSSALIITLFNLVPMSIDRLFYKISHSLILNIIYGEIIYFIIEQLPKKYKKIRIN